VAAAYPQSATLGKSAECGLPNDPMLRFYDNVHLREVEDHTA